MAILSFTRFCREVLHLSLTRGQRTLCKVIFDGIQPADLPADEKDIAISMFGGLIVVPPGARDLLVLRCGRWSGKTTLASAHGVYRLCTADLTGIRHGDRPSVIVISPGRDTSEEALSKALGLVEDVPFLKAMLVSKRADRFILRRPQDGKRVSFWSRAKAVGGRTLRGISIIEALIDEAEFVGAADPAAVIKDSDLISSIMPRLMAGGSLILSSTPWPAESETSRLFERNFGNPTTALAARAPTLLMRDHAPDIVAKVAREKERDEQNALREYECIPGNGQGLFFEASTIDKALSTVPVPPQRYRASAGIDLAFRSDASALVVVERQGDRIVVVHCTLLLPRPGEPLVPSQVVEQYASEARLYGCREFIADGHYIETLREGAAKKNIQVIHGPTSKAVEGSFLYVRDLLREGRLIVSPDLGAGSALLTQLRSVIAHAQPGGALRAVLPRAGGGGHADLVSALVMAIWLDRRFGPLTANTEVSMESFSMGPKRLDGLYVTGSVSGRY